MIYRPFGKTGLNVSAIGFGAGHIGSLEQSFQELSEFLNKILDSGINVIDTARSYGMSEERIGMILRSRRHEVILSTKVGYTFQDKPDWSYDAVLGTVEESLQRLKTDFIDIVHLHSCDKWVLEKGEAIEALETAKKQGKVRFIAYSGENEALKFAIDSNRFDSIQCSVNLFDQNSLSGCIPSAAGIGLGIIAKRPLGNAVWRYAERPDRHGHAVYYDRYRQMNFKLQDLSWNELAVRFSGFAPNVSTIIIGSSNQEHFFSNVEYLNIGPLSKNILDSLNKAFLTLGESPEGLI